MPFRVVDRNGIFSVFELHPVIMGINAVAAKQFLMSSGFHHPSAINGQNEIGMPDG